MCNCKEQYVTCFKAVNILLDYSLLEDETQCMIEPGPGLKSFTLFQSKVLQGFLFRLSSSFAILYTFYAQYLFRMVGLIPHTFHVSG